MNTKMKKIILTIVVAIMTTVGATAADTLTVRVKGMRCEECAHKVGNVIRKNAGIQGVDFNIERRTVTVAYDGNKTCADSIKSALAATGRYKSSPYSPTDTIMRGIGLRLDDMHCMKCANRVIQRVGGMEGIDSVAPNLDKHYVFIRYDANRTSKGDIKEVLSGMGFTPVNYYTSNKIDYAYFLIPEDKVNDDTQETALALDGVDDAQVCARNKSLAITYVKEETSEEKLIEALQASGIAAKLPPAHVCDEKQENSAK